MEKLEDKIYKLFSKNEKLLCFARMCSRIMNNDKQFIDDTVNWGVNSNILRIESKGDANPNQIVYIIKEQGNGYGFFAEFRSMLADLVYADSRGLSPAIVFSERFLYYQQEGVNGEHNPFYYYFSLKKEILNPEYSSKIVYALPCHVVAVEEEYNVIGYDVPIEFEEKLAYVFSKYIDIKKDLQKEFDEEKENWFNKKKVLGIHYRGTDYKKGYNVHPIAVTVQQQVKLAQKAIEENEFEKIFLATDEIGIYEIFRKEFGDIVKYYDDVYRGTEETSVAFSKSERMQHQYKLGLEVLRDTYMLSKCDGLIAGISQVSFSAKILKRSRNENYEYVQIIDNGINHNKKYFVVPK